MLWNGYGVQTIVRTPARVSSPNLWAYLSGNTHNVILRLHVLYIHVYMYTSKYLHVHMYNMCSMVVVNRLYLSLFIFPLTLLKNFSFNFFLPLQVGLNALLLHLHNTHIRVSDTYTSTCKSKATTCTCTLYMCVHVVDLAAKMKLTIYFRATMLPFQFRARFRCIFTSFSLLHMNTHMPLQRTLSFKWRRNAVLRRVRRTLCWIREM